MMISKTILIASTLGLTSMGMLSACQTSAPLQRADVECAKSEASARCILETADAELATVEDNFARISAAGELAVAHSVSGNDEKAETLISGAIAKSDGIEVEKKRATGLAEIVTAISDIKTNSNAADWLDEINRKAETLPEASRADIAAKSIVALAIHENPKQALQQAIALPQAEDYEANAKAITLRKTAQILAKNGDFEAARKGIDAITMSIPYYQAMVRSDVARAAAKKGKMDLANELLAEAEPIARAQDNGYFVGAALRDIGFSLHAMGESKKADSYFEDALKATANSIKQNEKARATSRVATRLSDAGLFERTAPILADSVKLAKDIQSDLSKGFTYYEIAGAASFSGEFALAQSLIAQVPDSPLAATTSLKSAAERDLAWGYARYGQMDKALEIANRIKQPREKIHALSRIVRLLDTPKMVALPRYP